MKKQKSKTKGRAWESVEGKNPLKDLEKFLANQKTQLETYSPLR